MKYLRLILFSSLCVFVIFIDKELNALETGYKLMQHLMSDDDKERRDAAEKLMDARDLSLIPALVDSLFFTPKGDRDELIGVLQSLTGEKFGNDYYSWVEFVGRRTDIKPDSGYLEWKATLLSKIDPDYKKILYPGVPARIRMEEVVWGGVKLGGIPSLERPPRVQGTEAKFLTGDEKVFGVHFGDESHAYPLRYLSWHEMVNDVVGGMPITLSF